jgi:hypothetical protein
MRPRQERDVAFGKLRARRQVRVLGGVRVSALRSADGRPEAHTYPPRGTSQLGNLVDQVILDSWICSGSATGFTDL